MLPIFECSLRTTCLLSSFYLYIKLVRFAHNWNDGTMEYWNNGLWGIDGMGYWENQVDKP